MKFLQKIPLNFFYTAVQKSQKWPKTQIKGGPALIKSWSRRSELPVFDIFAFPRWSPLRMRTKVVSFFIFSKSFQTKKINGLRPKMTKMTKTASTVLVKLFVCRV